MFILQDLFSSYLVCFQALKCHEVKSVYTWEALKGINLDLILFLVNAIIFAVLLIMIEKGIFRKIRQFLCKISNNASDRSLGPLDDDVVNERNRVLQTSSDSNSRDLLTVTNLKKQFGNFRAVDGLSFGVHYGECFGLLGINGAGKTTSFK